MEPTPEIASGAARQASSRPLLKVEGVKKHFMHGGRRLEVLRGIDLSIAQGEMLSIVGRSGAGKSTLLHILGTIDLPSAGRIIFDGRDLSTMSPSQLAAFRNKSVGFIFQFHHLLPEFSALENVMMPALIHRLSPREAGEAARDLLATVGLESRLQHRPGELSGGEQQRVALARALVLNPKLLLADEPTGNLDSETSSGIHNLFFRLNKELGTTMLIVTHNPELARSMPRALRMADGLLVGDEPTAAEPAPQPEAEAESEAEPESESESESDDSQAEAL